MTSYVFVLICFVLSFILQAVLNRIMKKYSVVAYFIGLCALCYFIRTAYIPLAWSSVVLYVLLSCLTVLLYIAISLGTELPSSIILASFQKKHTQSETALISLFSDRGLIGNRIDDLIESGVVTHSGNKLKLTKRGKIVWFVMNVYRVLFHRQQTE